MAALRCIASRVYTAGTMASSGFGLLGGVKASSTAPLGRFHQLVQTSSIIRSTYTPSSASRYKVKEGYQFARGFKAAEHPFVQGVGRGTSTLPEKNFIIRFWDSLHESTRLNIINTATGTLTKTVLLVSLSAANVALLRVFGVVTIVWKEEADKAAEKETNAALRDENQKLRLKMDQDKTTYDIAILAEKDVNAVLREENQKLLLRIDHEKSRNDHRIEQLQKEVGKLRMKTDVALFLALRKVPDISKLPKVPAATDE